MERAALAPRADPAGDLPQGPHDTLPAAEPTQGRRESTPVPGAAQALDERPTSPTSVGQTGSADGARPTTTATGSEHRPWIPPDPAARVEATQAVAQRRREQAAAEARRENEARIDAENTRLWAAQAERDRRIAEEEASNGLSIKPSPLGLIRAAVRVDVDCHQAVGHSHAVETDAFAAATLSIRSF